MKFAMTVILALIAGLNFGQKAPPLKCSNVQGGLKLCAESSSLVVSPGKNVVLKYVLKNTTNKPVTIKSGTLESLYAINVTNSRGEQVDSFNQTLGKNASESRASMEEYVRSLPINSGPAEVSIGAGKELNLEFNLSQYYNLSKPDTYQISIGRKVNDNRGRQVILLPGAVTVRVTS